MTGRAVLGDIALAGPRAASDQNDFSHRSGRNLSEGARRSSLGLYLGGTGH
jgi:hypothetical protein